MSTTSAAMGLTTYRPDRLRTPSQFWRSIADRAQTRPVTTVSTRDLLAASLSRRWTYRPALAALQEIQRLPALPDDVVAADAVRTLAGLDDLASQRYHLAQAVDRVDRTLYSKTVDRGETTRGSKYHAHASMTRNDN